jgi:hypothetical protein
MMSQAEPAEQRHHKRYQVPVGSFVTIGPHGSILGQIIDISTGGLAFRYMDSEKPTDDSYLDIFSTECDLCLCNIPFDTVSDYEIHNTVLCKVVDSVPPSCRAMKRSSVQFGELTYHQRSQLHDFLQINAAGEL